MRTICRPHSSCVLSTLTLTFAHSTIRQTTTHPPHDNNDPFRSDSLSSTYFKMRSSSRPAHRHPSHSHSRSHSRRTPSRPRRRFAFLRAPSAMFSTFNIIRASIYCTFFSFLDCRGLCRSCFVCHDSPRFPMEYCLLSYRGTLPERS